MHALRGTRRLLAGLTLAALTLGFVPGSAAAKPWPNLKPDGFKLFAKSFSNFGPNRVSLGLSTRGEVGNDTSGSGTVGGGYWPRGTADQYVFNSGLQIAGIIQGAKSASNPWGGDTTGAFFFDPKGNTRNGAEVTLIYNSNNPIDVANWPLAAFVPKGDSSEVLFDPLLRGTLSASQGDEWFVTWEGDPAFLAGRTHPMGVLAEYRIMGWNYPSGNEDIAYLIVTFYNITTTNPADYALHRPAMQDLLMTQAAKFQALNNAKFFPKGDFSLPTGGYTIGPMYAAFSADMDVGDANKNFVSVNLPFAMGFSYQTDFMTAPAWTFDPTIFGSPFFAGVGFVGTKYLKGPTGAGKIQLFSGATNGGAFGDPQTGLQLFRYLSAGLIPGIDAPCNYVGIPAETHVCWLQRTVGFDTRHFQSSEALTIKPGASASIVVAYIFAAPVALQGYTPTSANQIDPGDPTWTNHPDSMLNHLGPTGKPGVNRVDSITGFLGFTLPLGQGAHNPDGSEYQPKQGDFQVVPKSLLGKALVAQAVFDGHFLLPFAPDRPEFFLIPGNEQVTILWKPSPSDAATPGSTGDAFFALASSPNTVLPGGGTTPNLLYDPNYRKFDVEGYRIYRGRTDAPNALKLIAQFDYAGTVFKDFGGNVSAGNCAPEIVGASTADCPVAFTKITPGVVSTVSFSYPLVGELVQVKYGERALLASGKLLNFIADTLITGNNSGLPALKDNSIPFVFVDNGTNNLNNQLHPFNGVKYYYSVTAFDVNSWNSGPTSLESSRATKTVTAGAPATNYSSTGSVAVTGPYGRNVLLTDNVVPTIDPATGKFSKKQPPSNAGSVALGSFVTQILKAGDVAVTLDSITYVSMADGGDNLSTQWFSANGAVFSIPITIATADYADGPVRSTPFGALAADAGLSAVYGGGAGYTIPGVMSVQAPGGYLAGTKGRGCINGGTGALGTAYFGANRFCTYQGPRWFIGNNETMNNPNSDNPDKFTGLGNAVTLSNVGELAGVSRIFWPLEYFNTSSSWRREGGGLSGFISAADYRLYWGAAGKVDSVIDLTHNTVVPFKTNLQASWGILNNSAVPTTAYDGRAVLTFTDIGCVAPFKTDGLMQGNIPCSGATALLSNTAIPGPVAICATGALSCNQTAAPMPGQGFVLYLKGEVFVFELAAGGLPAAGTAWTMRDYVGGIQGGSGVAGNNGNYVFKQSPVRPFTAPGLTFKFAVQAENVLSTATSASLAKVHTVPDPYYVTSAYDRTTTAKTIKFVNLPNDATIRIYSASGILVKVLHNTSTSYAGIVDWDVRNRSNQFIASGVYFYVVESGGLHQTYRLTIVNFASNIQ